MGEQFGLFGPKPFLQKSTCSKLLLQLCTIDIPMFYIFGVLVEYILKNLYDRKCDFGLNSKEMCENDVFVFRALHV